MRLLPKCVLEMTHREFTMVCEENVERTYDENERSAMIAIMNAAASRGKGKKGKLPTVDELYKRPLSDEVVQEKTESLIEQKRHAEEWLSQFDLEGFDSTEKEDE